MWDTNDPLTLQKLELLAASLASEAFEIEKLVAFAFSSDSVESTAAKELLKNKFDLDLDDPVVHKKLINQLVRIAKEKNV